jgi:hypothetical protein
MEVWAIGRRTSLAQFRYLLQGPSNFTNAQHHGLYDVCVSVTGIWVFSSLIYYHHILIRIILSM